MQTILVWIIIALAAIYVIRKYTRSLTGKDHGCDCGTMSCGSCTKPDGTPCDFPKPLDKDDQS